MKQINILFLGGAKRVSMARMFKDAGRKLGLQVGIFGYELDKRVPLAAEGEIVIGRRWKDADLYDHLAETVDELGIDIIVPFVDPAVAVAAKFQELRPDVFAATSTAELSEAMFDKTVADSIFRNKNIPVPEPILSSSPKFPFIAKPRKGSASKGIAIVRSEADMAGRLFPEDFYLLQEYVEDADEYTVDCYVGRDGQVLGVVPRRRIEVTGGEVSVTETVRNIALMNLSAEVLTKIGFTGPVTLQFLHDKRRERFLLMEINPRLGGGAVCSVYAGTDIPMWILQDALGIKPSPAFDWKDKMRMTRYMQEVMFLADDIL